MSDIIIITTTLQVLNHKIFTTLCGLYDIYHWLYGEVKPWRGEVVPYGHTPGGKTESKPQGPHPAIALAHFSQYMFINGRYLEEVGQSWQLKIVVYYFKI